MATMSIVSAEVVLRCMGLLDFPLYNVDSQIGYLAKPNQSGLFLNRNYWTFNGQSMPTERRWNPMKGCNVLLVGNSIVMGGNPYDQSQKLTAQLERLIDTSIAIWPCAIGGWTNLNEIEYLRHHSDVANSADLVLWEYMQGGLSEITTWRGEVLFPTRFPVLATLYTYQKYVAPRLPLGGPASELPPTGYPNPKNLEKFDSALASFNLRRGSNESVGIIWLYPKQSDLKLARAQKEWLPERSYISEIARKNNFTVIDLSAHAEWTDTLYRDGVHPTPLGNTILAKILGHEIISSIASNKYRKK